MSLKKKTMLSQLRLTARINNQITIGLQNCPNAQPTIYKSLSCIEGGFSVADKARLQRTLDNVRKSKEPKYDWRGCLITRPVRPKYRIVPPPKLDLIRKFQRELKSARSALFGFWLAKSFYVCLEYFGQFRLNPHRQFSAMAGQRIREAGAAMEIIANSQMRFCHCTTLTLPANTRESFECLAAYSGYAVNRLFQVLRRKYPDMNYWFFCWEFQKRGALHLHIAHYHPDESEGMLIGNLLIEQWHKILCDISNNSGVDMFLAASGDRCTIRQYHQHHTQPIKKSVAGYFAKYAGKSTKCDTNSYVRKHAETLSPKRYWGSSFHLKKVVSCNSYTSLFDVHDEIEAENRYQAALSIILSHSIVSVDRYEFRKELKWKEVYGYKGKSENSSYSKVIAEGFRETFYVKPDEYVALLNELIAFDFAKPVRSDVWF